MQRLTEQSRHMYLVLRRSVRPCEYSVFQQCEHDTAGPSRSTGACERQLTARSDGGCCSSA